MSRSIPEANICCLVGLLNMNEIELLIEREKLHLIRLRLESEKPCLNVMRVASHSYLENKLFRGRETVPSRSD